MPAVRRAMEPRRRRRAPAKFIYSLQTSAPEGAGSIRLETNGCRRPVEIAPPSASIQAARVALPGGGARLHLPADRIDRRMGGTYQRRESLMLHHLVTVSRALAERPRHEGCVCEAGTRAADEFSAHFGLDSGKRRSRPRARA